MERSIPDDRAQKPKGQKVSPLEKGCIYPLGLD